MFQKKQFLCYNYNMAYDGIFIKSQINEFKMLLLDNHITKITQKENHEVNFHIKNYGKYIILTLSAFKSFPYMKIDFSNEYSSENVKSFGMILKKYLQSGKFVDIKQICNENMDTFERNIDFTIKSINEQGEYENFHLIFELMGRYTNLILTNSDYIIIDTLYKTSEDNLNNRLSINSLYKPIYVENKINFDFNDNKKNINALINIKDFFKINKENFDLNKIFLNTFYGFSKTFLLDIFYKLNIDTTNVEIIYDDKKINTILDEIKKHIILSLEKPIPTLFFENETCKDFHIMNLNIYNKMTIYSTTSELINMYLNLKFGNSNTNINHIKDDILELIHKYNKKLDIINSSIEHSRDFVRYKTYGELILTYGYDKNNFKNNKLLCKDINNKSYEIEINLENSINENANNYFKKYKKLKKSIEVSNQMKIEITNSIEHLNEILDMLEISNNKNDIFFIKEELNNYFKKNSNVNNQPHKNKKKINYNIHKFISSDGIKILVGKNNIQNEYLTFDLAKQTDTWFHIKNAHGAHVIVNEHIDNIPDTTIKEAAELAGYFSNYKSENKVTIDYTLKKELKKVKGKPPGFCIYHKYKSIVIKPKLCLKELF